MREGGRGDQGRAERVTGKMDAVAHGRQGSMLDAREEIKSTIVASKIQIVEEAEFC